MSTALASFQMVAGAIFQNIDEATNALDGLTHEDLYSEVITRTFQHLHAIKGALILSSFHAAAQYSDEIILACRMADGSDTFANFDVVLEALHTLKRYLENAQAMGKVWHEVLIEDINRLRLIQQATPLAESHFFQAEHLLIPRVNMSVGITSEQWVTEGLQCCKAYQHGLLQFIKNNQDFSGLRLMWRALERLDQCLGNDQRNRLPWLATGMIEAMYIGRLIPNNDRLKLLARVDRELHLLMRNKSYQPPKELQLELVYLVLLADCRGAYSNDIIHQLRLKRFPFSEQRLLGERIKLKQPSQDVYASLSQALSDEIAYSKNLMDAIQQGFSPADGIVELHKKLQTLSKIFAMVGLHHCQSLLTNLDPLFEKAILTNTLDASALTTLAESMIYLENQSQDIFASNHGLPQIHGLNGANETRNSIVKNFLKEAHKAILTETHESISDARRALVFFHESDESLHLHGVPESLLVATGALSFLDFPRVIALITACASYIHLQMAGQKVSSTNQVTHLVDALAGLEMYFESVLNDTLELAPHALESTEYQLRQLG